MNVSDLKRRWQFLRRVKRSRFAEALALLPSNSVPSTGVEQVACYRLGLYDTVAKSQWDGVHQKAGIAIAVSLAYCGSFKKSKAVADKLLSRHGKGKYLNELADALAPVMPELSVSMIQDSAPIVLRVALLLRNGMEEDAAVLVKKALAEQKTKLSPELFLLATNVSAGTAQDQLKRINSYLHAFKLPAIQLRENSKPPGPLNLISKDRVKLVEGPLVSILMTSYNSVERIGAAIESLLAQSWRNIEIVVVDDASTDKTESVVREWAEEDRRVRYLKMAENGGTYVAKTAGLNIAQGEFITCHDSDDWSHPLRIEKQMQPLLENSHLVATSSKWVRMQDDGKFYARPVHPLARLNPASPLFRRREVENKAGLWDLVRTGADSEFYARLRLVFGRKAVKRVDLPLAFGSHRPDSLMTASNTGYSSEGVSPMRLKYWESWTHWHIDELRAGRKPFMSSESRPFKAPSEILVNPINEGITTPRGIDKKTIVGCFSKGIASIPNLNEFLNANEVIYSPTKGQADKIDLIVGWGRKRNTKKAIEYSKQSNIPFISLEDGFIRSVGVGRTGSPSVSMVLDRAGIYYDSGRASDLENILNGGEEVFVSSLIEDAQQALNALIQNKISKYNGAKSFSRIKKQTQKNILIIDQVAGDASLAFGAKEFNLDAMVSAAIKENPESKVFVKLHPETAQGFRKGLFSNYRNNSRIQFIEGNYNPLSVLENMDKVYVATSQLGFEALMLGKEVVCFGVPFYAGWGLTDDRVKCSRRVKKRTVEEVFAAAYILYSRYVNPVTGKRCDIMEALEYLHQQIQMEETNQQDIFCFGIRHWTRVNIKPFLTSTQNKVHFIKSVAQARRLGIKQGDQVVVWGTRKPDGLEELVSITEKPAMTMEDGFLRSVGLGSDFVRPSSLVLDSDGIYFDPEKPSGLELILQKEVFSTDILKKAERVRKKIIAARLTKYNLEPSQDISIAAKPGQTVILAPGQVEDDASIQLGCESINSNLGLLKAIREKNPDAYIIYKPHPDVESGNRTGKVDISEALQYCDQVIDSISIANCLDLAEEVHTMTSLVGFEALMRKIPVTVYGKPFYAGWGLTEDEIKIGRRNRRLILAELVAGTLLLYPRYYDWESGSFTDCEMTIDKLIVERDKAESKTGLSRLRVSYVERQLRKLGMLAKGVTHA